MLKKEKICWGYHFTRVTKITIIWYGVRQTEFFLILGHFLSFNPLSTPLPLPPVNDPENQNFEEKNNEKKFLEILSFYTYMCTMNKDHMIFGSWNIRCARQNVLSFQAIFCLFSPLTTWKIKVLKLKKAPGFIIIL